MTANVDYALNIPVRSNELLDSVESRQMLFEVILSMLKKTFLNKEPYKCSKPKNFKNLLNEVLKANPKSNAIMQHAKLTNGTLEMQGLGACHFVAETGTDLTGFLDVRMYNKTGNLAYFYVIG